MRRLLAFSLASALLSGCERDPVWLGYWEITEATRDGVRQTDLGEMELMRNGELAVILRYRWTGAEFVPDEHPEVLFGSHNATEQDDIFEAYKEEGEVYTVNLSPFVLDQRDLAVKEHYPGFGVLTGTSHPWPGRPPDELGRTELRIQR